MYEFLTEAPTFKEYQDNYGQQFVGLLLSDKSASELRSWCLKNGFDLNKSFSGEDISPEKFDFHTTIYYTSNEVYLKSGQFMIESVPLVCIGFDAFGKEKNIPVLKLNPDGSHIRDFRTLFKTQGLEDQWPEWKPHISLSYNYSGNPNLESLELPTFPIMADQVVIKKSSS